MWENAGDCARIKGITDYEPRTNFSVIDKRRYKIRLDFVYIAVWNFNVYGPYVWAVHPR